MVRITPFFCTASKTARDVAQDLLMNGTNLPPHNLEKYCLPLTTGQPQLDNTVIAEILHLLEVYMDDFIGLTQAPTHQDLVHFTRAVLHGIHTVFPLPTATQPEDDEPIAIAKLNKGDGLWATQKEILSWMFDGTTWCINLPADKVDNILRSLKEITRGKSVRIGELEKINGKLMHATIGIPNGCGLLSPIIAAITAIPKTRNYKERRIRLNMATTQALQDWKTLLPTANRHPTPCEDLVPTRADYGGYCDASKHGAGGVWFGINKALPPIVWRVPFPSEIQQDIVSLENPQGKITNSDLEMAGLLLQWLVLEQFADLAHTHVSCWCDNTPTIAWASRLLSTKAPTAARLLRTLALHMLECRASPLTAQHIPGVENKMADFASRSFDQHKTAEEFLTTFHNRFSPPQNKSWIFCRLPQKTIGRVTSMLSMQTSKLESWRRHMPPGTVIGGTGATFFHQISTRTFKNWMRHNDLWSCKSSLAGYGKEHTDEENKSKWVASRQPSGPSVRQSSWLDTPTRCTNPAQPTTTPLWHSKAKHTNGRTPSPKNS